MDKNKKTEAFWAKPIPQGLLDIVEYRDGIIYWKEGGRKRKAGNIAGGLYSASRTNRTRWRLKYKGKSYYRSRVVWALFNGEPGGLIDHIDGNTLNDKIENLRVATNGQNQHNRDFKQGVTGVKGLRVFKYRRKNNTTHLRWLGVVDHNRHRYCTNKFPFTEEGKKACVGQLTQLREKLHGEFTNHG